MTLLESIGIVVIGRNEGARLKNCIENMQGSLDRIVYVDSGSSDGSAEYAKSKGIMTVELDMRIPFSAGRARNEGVKTLVHKLDGIEFIQFIDGDCELYRDWLERAVTFLSNDQSYAIVSGRRKERFPEQSIYTLLCDIEWQAPEGDAKSCGGDFMIRKKAFLSVDGFDPSVVAGEEPELCYRLRQQGWKIRRLGHLMTYHDAAITRFYQWWKRSVRSGHAYAQGLFLHGLEPERYCLRDSLRIWFWTLILPFTIICLAFFNSWCVLLIIPVYFFLSLKIAINLNKFLFNWKHALLYSIFNIVGKFAQLSGQIFFLIKKLYRKQITLIEYK